MKKKVSAVVLSCLTCISMLAYSTLPVHAWNPENCQHSYLADCGEMKTGAYDYRDNGHYAEYVRTKYCLKCNYEVYNKTTYAFESEHNFENTIQTMVRYPDGTVEYRYYCNFDDCPYYIMYE